jgi:hypothetical protein
MISKTTVWIVVMLSAFVWVTRPAPAQNQTSDITIVEKNPETFAQPAEADNPPCRASNRLISEGFPLLVFDADSRSTGNLNSTGLAWSERELSDMPMALSQTLDSSPGHSPTDMDPSSKETSAPGGWEFEIGTYLWMADVSADMGADDVVVEMDEEFKDTLKIVDWGGVLLLQARKDRWHIFSDLQYMALEDDDHESGIKIETTTRQAVTELGAGYRFGDRDMFIEPLLGLRYFYLKNKINIKPGPRIDGTTDWLDLFVGGIFEAVLTEKWSFALQGNVGGFGLGSGSDLTWVATTGLKWHITKKSYIGFGYRHMDIDFDHDGIKLDGYFTGPMIGYNYKF